MKYIKNNKFIIAILAITIVLLFLGTVSAVDDKNIDTNLTVEDNTLEVSELNENIDDTNKGEASSVNVLNEQKNEDLLSASDDGLLSDVSTTLTPVSGFTTVDGVITATVNEAIYIKMSDEYDTSYYKPSDSQAVYVRASQYSYDNLVDSPTYGQAISDEGVPLVFTTTGMKTFIFKVATSSYDIYSNSITINVVDAPSTTETETSISINPQTVAPNNPITITPTVLEKGTTTEVSQGTLEFFYTADGINTISMGTWVYGSQDPFTYTFENEGVYDIFANYKENTLYSESNSTLTSILVNSNTELSPVTVTVTLNSTGVGPQENIAVNVSVKNNNGEDITGSVNLFDGDGNAIDSNVVIGEVYQYQAPSTPSNYQIYAVYEGSNVYASRNSSKVSFTVKNKVTLSITINGESNVTARTGSYYSGPFYKVNVTSDVDDLVVNVYDLYYDDSLMDSNKSVNSEVASWYFESNEVGEHEIYVKFMGNDNYLESESNHIKFNVYTSRQIQSLTLTPNYGIENQQIEIVPLVRYYDYSTGYINIEGNLTLYNDSSYTQEIISINADGENNFTYTVRENTGSYASSSYYIYYTFEAVQDEYCYYGSGSISFNTMNENSLIISAKNSTDGDSQSETVYINKGDSVIFTVDSLNYKYTYSTTNISIYIEGNEDSIDKFPTSGSYGTTIEDYTLTFNPATYPENEYVVYAVYEGYFGSSSYYAPATSNKITVKIIEPTKDTLITLAPAEITAKQGEAKTITSNVSSDEESVGVGTITYYDNGTAIEGYIDVNVGTEFSTANLNIGIHNITAKYNGGEGFNPSEISNELIVTIEKATEVIITITSPTYPLNATATITGEAGKTYTVNIAETGTSFEITIPEGQTQQIKELNQLDAGTYSASVMDESASTTFTVHQGDANLIVTVMGNDTLVGSAKNITVSALGEGKFTINDDATEHELSEVIDLTDLSQNTTFTIHYNSTNYNASDKSVFVTVYTSYTTEISIELSKNSITKGESIIITPTVVDQKGNAVDEGQITFYDGEDNPIETIDLKTNKTYEYKATASGSIYAKYLDNNELKLTGSISDARTFTVNLPTYNTTTTLELSSSEMVYGQNITIKAYVVDENGNNVTSGFINIYDDAYAYNDYVARFNVSETSNYTDTKYSSGHTQYLYAKFMGLTTDEAIYNPSPVSAGVSYTILSKNTLTLTVNKENINAGQNVSVSATLTGGNGVISLSIDGEDNGTLTNGEAREFVLNEVKDYKFQATYTRGSDYYASAVSDEITVHVSEAPEIAVDIKLDATSVSKNGVINIDVNVTDKGVELNEGIVEILNDSGKIGEVNLSNSKTYTLNVGNVSGSYNVWAKFGEVNSTKKEYKVKDTLTITLTRDGEALVKVGDTVYFNIVYSSPVSQNLELWVNNVKINDEDGGSSTSVKFDEAYIGKNNVSIKFLGSDDFEACESNNVTVDVIKALNTTVTIELSSVEVVTGQNITIRAHVVDENGNNVTDGNVSIYLDDSFATGEAVVSFDVGGSANYTDSINVPGSPHYLYAKFIGLTTDEAFYNPSPVSSGVSYNKVYANTLTLTANGESELTVYAGMSVDILAVLTGGNGIITLYVDGVANQTLTKDVDASLTLSEIKDYEFTAKYQMNSSDLYASAESGKVIVHVIEAPEIIVNINLDNTSVSKNSVINIDVNVTDKGVELNEGIVEILNDSGKIGEVNLSNSKTYTLNVGDVSGSYNVWAKFGEVNSTKKEYKVKDTLTITLARDGEDLVKINDTVSFTITYSSPVSQNLELWVNNVKIGGEDGSSSTSVKFDEADVGENNVSIKFLGSDEFEACESNIVLINVLKPLATNVTLILSSSEVFSSKNFTITPKVLDENGVELTVGVVKIYNTQYYSTQDPIASVNASESVNYADTINNIGTVAFLYGVYMGTEGDNVIYAQSPVSEGVNYTVMGDTRLNLTANGALEINVVEGTNIDVLASIVDGDGEIALFIDGVLNTTLTKNTPYSLTLPVGNYTLKANYTRGNDYYASALSNEVKIHVIANDTVNEIKVSVSDVTLPDDAVVVVTATIDGVYEVDINGTSLNVSVVGGVGSNNITLSAGEYYANITSHNANVENALFKVSEASQESSLIAVDLNSTTLKITNGVETPIVSVTLPANATGTVTVSVGGKKFSGTLVNGSVSVKITGLSSGNYNALINYSGDSQYFNATATSALKVVKTQTPSKVVKVSSKITAKAKTFKVKKAKKYSIILKATNGLAISKVKVTLKVKGKTYTAKTNAKGKATFNLKKLTKKGTYKVKINFKGNANYKSSSKTVKIKVKK